MIIGIVAIAENFAIGKDGKLPWHYSADLQFFKETTMGNSILMGSNTWRSIGRPLPGRLNIVLSRSRDLETPPDVVALGSVSEAVAMSKYLSGDLFVIGGAKTFEAFVDAIDRWIVTYVPETVDGADTFMPLDFLDNFEILEIKDLSDNLQVRTFKRN